jgi:hypothetical protein
MEAERPPAPGPGCERPPPRAAGRGPEAVTVPDPSGLRTMALWLSAESPDQRAAPVTVPAPPQVPVGGSADKVSPTAKMASGLRKLWAPRAWQRGVPRVGQCVSVGPARHGAAAEGRFPPPGSGAGPEAGPPCPHLLQPVWGAGAEQIQVGGRGSPVAASIESSPSAGPFCGRRLCGLGVRAAAGAAGRGPRGPGDLGGGGGGAPDAVGAHPGASAEVSQGLVSRTRRVCAHVHRCVQGRWVGCRFLILPSEGLGGQVRFYLPFLQLSSPSGVGQQ